MGTLLIILLFLKLFIVISRGHGRILKVSRRVHIMIHSLPRITLQVQNKQMHETCWLEKQPRAAETYKKKKVIDLSLYLYPFNIHSFGLTLEDCPVKIFHSFFSHMPFHLSFLSFCEMIFLSFTTCLNSASSINCFN